ncbi:hypothetical protein [Prauserella cavernicola]|uniref:Uncharacterized protein n=1 Tax=Prauserella cavernicola TaxID=2800127 RepID=A0A934QVX0_9PSEU|nr:hypothetical protein [Prauserella cavernicola]MBK1789247.1 hypothetical protein [Prauserella cavernicola]
MSDALDRLEARAEVLKLARVLGVEPQSLTYLHDVASADIRRLREQATDTLFDANLGALRRMATASKLLPAGPLASIAEKAFGPLLSARMAGIVDAGRGVEIASRLSTGFLADVAAELDPRRAAHIITKLPAATVTEVSAVLRVREDWITLGRFVGQVPDEIAATGLSVLDDVALLRVAFLLEDKGRAGVLFGTLPDERHAGIVTAAFEHDLFHALFDLLVRLDADTHERLALVAAALPAEVRATAADEASDLGLLDDLGPIRDALLT